MVATLNVTREERVNVAPDEITVSVGIAVSIMVPSPLPGGGMGLRIECNYNLDDKLEDAIIRQSRVAILKAMQHKMGGLPEDGMRVTIGINLPKDWEGVIGIGKELPETAADVTRRSILLAFTGE